MDRAQLSHLAHAHHPVAAPVSAASARALLRRLPVPLGGRVLDLGCGQGQWLLMLLQERRDLTAVGVDTSQAALAAAERAFAAHGLAAAAHGLAARATWHLADAAGWAPAEHYDAVLSVGASHAHGGLNPTLQALHHLTTATGCVLLGDGFWKRPPSAAAQDALQMSELDMPDLPGLVDQVLDAGWLPITGHTSTAQEWDDDEWAWTGSLAQWAQQQPPGDPDAGQALDAAAAHRAAWLRGYRHQYGSVALVLIKAHALRA